MRVLFFNEGNLGSQVMGQGQLQQALEKGLAAQPEQRLQARFAPLSPLTPFEHAMAVKTFGPLTKTGLEFRALRWHLIQAARTRRELRRELRAWPADVAHVHSHSIAFLAGGGGWPPLALSVDCTVHDWWAMPAWRKIEGDRELALRPSSALERRAFRRASLVLAWTGWARRAVERSAPEANTVELHPGIDLDRYRPAARRERELPRILFVGGRFAEKGGEDLLSALSGRLGETVELDVVTPAELAPRPGLRVHRLGPDAPELLDLHQQADLFCLPSYGDAAPWAVLEAMACGTAVLATEVGGIPDQLDHGRAGVMVRHGDRRALRAAIDALLEQPGQRGGLGERARARCEERFDAVRQTARLLDLVEGL